MIRGGTGLALSLAATPLFAQADPASSPGRLTSAPLSTAHLLETAGGLLLVLALIVGLAWLVRRMGRVPGAGKGTVQIVGGVSLGPRERAVVLSVQGVRLLVGVAPGRVQTLHVLGPQPTADEPAAIDRVSFEEHLAQAAEAGGEG